ncbi:MAG: BolA/IbaG family iron-sulfur metabolism protein [Halieaceae bacterium]|jgi:acid stress-induced BolA-like protein IbaG/YrbA|nr:BolA/IbaG family iron-sulfur metabolism protein [Halieaceae bacterium]
MQPQELQAVLNEQLESCEVTVRGEGSHYDILVIGEMFEGLRPVQKQQAVYKVLNPYIADGSVHAVNIRTYTPAEWQAQSA